MILTASDWACTESTARLASAGSFWGGAWFLVGDKGAEERWPERAGVSVDAPLTWRVALSRISMLLAACVCEHVYECMNASLIVWMQESQVERGVRELMWLLFIIFLLPQEHACTCTYMHAKASISTNNYYLHRNCI